MRRLSKIAIGLPLVALGAASAAYLSSRSAAAEAEEAWRDIASAPAAPEQRFHPSMVAGLPEIAQRYFTHAIEPGTPLRTRVELDMRGTFLLGDRNKYQSYAMRARQILAPPHGFVWVPNLRSGITRITGSDGLSNGKAWTRFWLLGLVPVANVGTSADVVRSARFRSVVESIWAPAALLPQFGARWTQRGHDAARVTVPTPEGDINLDMRLSADGAVQEVVGQRWSNANPEQVFRLQPFGGTIREETKFAGYTVPSRVAVGNHYGTPDYLPFFQAEIIEARYR